MRPIVRIALAVAALAEGVVGGPLDQVILITASYLAFSAVAEAVRRLAGRRGLGLVGLSLLVDGVYIAWVVYLTGGTLSPLRFLFYVHIVAVTLLASYRTGLKLALWYSLLTHLATLHERRGESGPASGWREMARRAEKYRR